MNIDPKLNIASPCRGICKIDEDSQLCLGCQRNIDEISRWRKMDDDQKLAVLSDCLTRTHQLTQQLTDAQQIPSSAGSSSKDVNMADGLPGNTSEGCE